MKAKIIHQAFEKDARDILRVIKGEFPEARVASGCPADVKGLSDVDILVFREGVDEMRIQKRMQGREVNVLVTGDVHRKRALQHREFELREMREAALLLDDVADLKRLGVNTEAAWVRSLGFELRNGESVYDKIADAQAGTPRPQLLAGVT